jgi:hypothetical protein
VAVPRPGQPFEPAGELPAELWWRAVAVPPQGGWAVPVTRPRQVRGAGAAEAQDGTGAVAVRGGESGRGGREQGDADARVR